MEGKIASAIFPSISTIVNIDNNNIYVTANTIEDVCVNDLSEGIEVLIRYIVANRRRKSNHESF